MQCIPPNISKRLANLSNLLNLRSLFHLFLQGRRKVIRKLLLLVTFPVFTSTNPCPSSASISVHLVTLLTPIGACVIEIIPFSVFCRLVSYVIVSGMKRFAHPPRQLPACAPSSGPPPIVSTTWYTGTSSSGPVAGGLSSAETCLKKAIEEESGRRSKDLMIGLRPNILTLSWRMENTWARVVLGGRLVTVLTSQVALSTVIEG
jgi:hypothetical protein